MKKYEGQIYANDSMQIEVDKYGNKNKVIVKMVKLPNLLDTIPDNNWMWWLYEFEGVTLKSELPIIPKNSAYLMNWKELKEFADDLGNVTDCLLIATLGSEDIDFDKIVNATSFSDFPECKAIVEVFDSSNWEIRLADNVNLIKNVKMTLFT